MKTTVSPRRTNSPDQLILKFKSGTGKVIPKGTQKLVNQDDPNSLVAAIAQLGAVENTPPRYQKEIEQFNNNCELTKKSRSFYGN